MYVASKGISTDAPNKILYRDEQLAEPSLTRKHRAIQAARMRGGGSNEPFHVRVAADHTVERHDIGLRHTWGQHHEVSLEKRDTIRMAVPCCLFLRGPNICGGRIDVNRSGGTGGEQLPIHHADTGTDIEYRQPAHAISLERIDQEPGGLVGAPAPIPSKVASRASIAEDRLI